MKREVYEELKGILLQQHGKDPLQATRQQFPDVSTDTLLSIYSQECSRRQRANYHLYRSARRIEQYVRRYAAGQSMLEISEELDLPPCLLARILLEHMAGLPKQDITPCLRDPTILPSGDLAVTIPHKLPYDSGGDEGVTVVSVPVERIRRDIALCVENDSISSPHVENLRRLAGLEYEARLQEKLIDLGIPFESEEDLRAAGFSKTPDVKLVVPIAVNGHVVNWIDSKASFGDDFMHRTQASEQFQRYVNRFGPGMVIYWFDFIEGLDDNPDVLLLNDFPRKDGVYRLPEVHIQPRE